VAASDQLNLDGRRSLLGHHYGKTVSRNGNWKLGKRHFIRILKYIRSLGGAWEQFPILDGPLIKSGKIQIPGKAGGCEKFLP
jgi:hypothetical protein